LNQSDLVKDEILDNIIRHYLLKIDIYVKNYKDMRENLIFRLWYYLRTGWSTYFAFIFAAINTLVVTYYLAIENLPVLQKIFPTFFSYILVIVALGIPILVSAGYIHFKKSTAYKAEVDISVETNPHMKRLLVSNEAIMMLFLKMSNAIIKIGTNEKLTDDEAKEILELQKAFEEYIKKEKNFKFISEKKDLKI
jgi:hypothetical protein